VKGGNMKKTIFLSVLSGWLVLTGLVIVGVRAQEKCEAPILNVGDEWSYKNSRDEQWKQKVLAIENGVYLIQYGKEIRGFDMKTMNLIFLINGEKREKFTGSRGQVLNFPMFIGKKWTKIVSLAYAYTQWQKEGFLEQYSVSAFEDIQTEAGTFRAFRIEYRQQRMATWGDYAIGTYWYAPEVKTIVKRVEKKAGNMPSMELVAYKVQLN
jgi:hypothetical protein